MWSKHFDKHLASLLLLIICLTLLAACGELEESTAPVEESAEPVEEEAPPLVAPTSPSQDSSATEIASIEKALAEIDAQLTSTLQGNIAHSAPSNMEVDETAEVTLLVSPSVSEEELASEITADGEVRTTSINITPWMHADLISPDPKAFNIQAVHGDPQQPLSNVEPTEWTWLVTAQEEGERRLILIISRLVEVEDRESWRQVEEYNYPILVNITLGNRLKNAAAGLWDFKWWIGGIVFPIIVFWIIRRLDR